MYIYGKGVRCGSLRQEYKIQKKKEKWKNGKMGNGKAKRYFGEKE